MKKIRKIVLILVGSKMINHRDVCLMDTAATHTILEAKNIYSHLTMGEAHPYTISINTN